MDVVSVVASIGKMNSKQNMFEWSCVGFVGFVLLYEKN